MERCWLRETWCTGMGFVRLREAEVATEKRTFSQNHQKSGALNFRNYSVV